MMECKTDTYRAIVVDDEVIVQKMLTFALEREGFSCDVAGDGVEASALLGSRVYDLVVTDLRMPHKHGYSLALEILADCDRPVVLVHTSIDDPRLTQDLLVRGIDDISYKPTDYSLFATRARSLVERRRSARCATGVPTSTTGLDDAISDVLAFPRPTKRTDNVNGSVGPDAAEGRAGKRVTSCRSAITLPELTKKLKQLATVLPMSGAALDVVDLVRDGNHSAEQIAAATARDPSLAVEVLRLANSSFYNPAGQKIAELERAVMRIGLRRVGELAMATTALTTLTTNVLPWMDVSLAWQRSIAAALAVDVLVDQAGLADEHEGLFLSALMHGLGRVALGTLFPNEYARMIHACRETNQPLVDREAEVFPESHSETMVRLLEVWNFPSEICEPLKHVLIPFSGVCRLDEPLRKKVALLKLGVLVGRLAVGRWEPWDVVDLPGDDVTTSLGNDAILNAIVQTKGGLFKVVHFRKHAATDDSSRSSDKRRTPLRVSYCSVSRRKIDFLRHVAASMDIVLQARDETEYQAGKPVLVNGIGCPSQALAPYLTNKRGCRHQVIVGDDSSAEL
ncbi:MAG: HDOD domain-containing protein, partial [Pirellulaceae bacterium]